MKKYVIVEKPLFLKGGILTLTKEQAESRKHVLKHLGKDRYEITGEVCFKIGEEIGYDGPVSKRQTNLEAIKKKSKPETDKQGEKNKMLEQGQTNLKAVKKRSKPETDKQGE